MTKKLIIKILVFLLLFSAVNFLLNSLYKRKMIMNRLFNLQDEQLKHFDDTLTFLLMGNSHMCLNPQIIGSSFNYASPNENYTKNYYKLKAFLENSDKRPQYIIIQVNLSAFSPFASNRFKYDSYWVKYADYFELAKIKGDKDYIYKWFEGKYFSYVGKYKEIAMSLYFKADSNKIVNGYKPPINIKNFKDREKRLEKGFQRAKLYLDNYHQLDPVMTLFFKKFVELCTEYDIEIIVVQMPVSSEYFEGSLNVIDRNMLTESRDSIIKLYPNIVLQLDYQDIFFEHPEYFYNPDHPNPVGANIVSGMIRADLEYLGIND